MVVDGCGGSAVKMVILVLSSVILRVVVLVLVFTLMLMSSVAVQLRCHFW